MPGDGINDDGTSHLLDEVERFVDRCRKRHRLNNVLSASLVVLGYALLVGATAIGILRDNGGRLAACCTFLTVVAIGLEQSFGFSEAADVQGVILAEAEILLSDLTGIGVRRPKPEALYERLNELRLRLARVSRRARVDHLRNLLEQGRPTQPPSPYDLPEDRSRPGGAPP